MLCKVTFVAVDTIILCLTSAFNRIKKLHDDDCVSTLFFFFILILFWRNGTWHVHIFPSQFLEDAKKFLHCCHSRLKLFDTHSFIFYPNKDLFLFLPLLLWWKCLSCIFFIVFFMTFVFIKSMAVIQVTRLTIKHKMKTRAEEWRTTKNSF